ncbi:MAG: ABC transporter permease, partial [Calditrichaeota bacterium]|nr:ABC transporter permease [Calditrichota bacterium]
MFKNYLKVAIRNLLKHKLNSGINIFGLAVGFAASIVIFLFARNELTYEAFHENAESIYLVYKERITPTGTQITRDTWVPMAEQLKREYAGIAAATRIYNNNDWVQYQGRRFQEQVTYVDPSFLNIFTFPLASGEAESVFSDLNSVVISQAISRKYFGYEDPIGQTITINYQTVYTVRGTLKEIPQNSLLQIDFLVPIQSSADYNEFEGNWDTSFLFTYILLSQGITPGSLEEQFPDFVAKIWDDEIKESMRLKLLNRLDLYNELTEANKYAYILLAIAAVILLIASINFMNLTTARSIERAREIGMRKVLGAFKHQLIKQFLSESLIMSGVALLMAIGLVEIVLPVFNSYYDMSPGLSYIDNSGTVLLLPGLALFVGLLSGLYPAFVISRFQPINSLKGQLKTSPTGLRLRYGLVITQFCLAIILMIGTGTMWKQLSFMKNADLNFEKNNIIAITVRQSDFENPDQAMMRLERFKNELRGYGRIKSVSSSTHIPGQWPGWFIFAYPTDRDDSQRLRVRRAFVDAHYFETYKIDFVEGRNFSESIATDMRSGMIINEAALRDIGWPSAEGGQIKVGSAVYDVIGVVQDYHFQSLASKVAPVLHFYRPPGSGVHRVISAKITPGNIQPPLDFIEEKWSTLDPTRPFEFTFVDENIEQLYQNDQRLASVASSFALIAIIIACLGLFALSAIMVT